MRTEHWTVDKKIPVALLVALSLQFAGAIWWGATTSARIDQLERDVKAAAPQAERLIRVEEKLSSMQSSLAEIKGLLARPRPAIAD